eukprot:9109800-Alexandrium_andersonii.AAC.1
MPSLYYTSIPVHDKATNTSTEVDFPFLLPHELLHHMIKKDSDLLHSLAQLKQPDLDNLHSEWAKKFGIHKEVLVPI